MAEVVPMATTRVAGATPTAAWAKTNEPTTSGPSARPPRTQATASHGVTGPQRRLSVQTAPARTTTAARAGTTAA